MGQERHPIMVPPVWALLFMGGMLGLDRYLPVANLWDEPWTSMGWGLAVFAALMPMFVALQFRHAKTTIMPHKTPEALITGGMFAFSRNPIYLAFALGLFGVAIILGAATPLIMPPLYILLINKLFIAHEERLLEDLFGDAFRAYKRRVRRWI